VIHRVIPFPVPFLIHATTPSQTIDLKLDLADLQLSAEFKQWLDRLIEPAAERRFPSAESALLALQGQAQPFESLVAYRPKQTKVTLLQTEDAIKIQFFVPPTKALSLKLWLTICVIGSLALLVISWLTVSANLNSYLRDLLYNAGYFGWVGLLTAAVILSIAFSSIRAAHILVRPTRIEIDSSQIQIQGVFQPLALYAEYRFGLSQVQDIYLRTGRGSNCCVLQIAGGLFYFGHYLSLAERRWLVHEIQELLSRVKQN
jgi:hypothetical protein